jgi:DHA1 family bicyclomycin/chloramphenicol resistance-like MFS transporter
MTAPGGAATETAPGAPRSRAQVIRVLTVLGCLASFGPLSIDMYLPAFPELAADFDTTASHIQLTLTGCFVGLGLGQLLVGPASDALGRRGPLLAGLAVYVIASLLCAIAPSATLLVVFRFVQGASGAAGVVLSRAIVRDLYTGVAAARSFARLMLVSNLTLILAPMLGGLVLRFTSWRGIFVVLAAIGLVLLVVSHLWLRETLPQERRRPSGLEETLGGLGELVRHRVFVGYTLSFALGIGVIFAHIAGSSFVFQNVYGLSAQLYAVVFGTNAVGILVCVQVSGFLVGRVTPRRLLLTGLAGLSGGSVALLAVVLAGGGLEAFLPVLFVMVASAGFVIPNAPALGLADHPHLAGSASALMGLTQFLVGSTIAPLVGIAGSGTAVPMALVMAVSGVGAIACFAALTRPRYAPE